MIEWLRAAMRRRTWPLLAGLATFVVGALYSFAWAPVVRHQSAWVVPGDIWATYRGAHFVAWGALGEVYGSHTYLVSLPGTLLLLAPVSMLTSALGMSEGFPITIAHPTAWLVLGPAIVVMGSMSLLGMDALAEVRGLNVRERRLLAFALVPSVWTVVVYWGHPEDALAVGLVAYALAAAHRRSWRACGWLLGLGVVMQPIALLAAPAFCAWAPRRIRTGILVRLSLPAVVLTSLLLVSDFSATWSALTRQPNYPGVDHATPWVWLSPSLGNGAVAAGPGRILAVTCALGIGVWVGRRRRWGEHVDLVMAVVLALAGRCVFEPVMVPFYLAPAIMLLLLLAAERSGGRLASTSVISLGLTVFAHTRAGPVLWWLVMMVLLMACAGSAVLKGWPCLPRWDRPRLRTTLSA
jgi:hypothetical protein